MRHVILISLLAVLPHSVLAAKGGNAITFAFDDLPGDAIRSDGLGSYAGSVQNRDGSFAIKGSMFLDFSMPTIAGALQPFGPGEDSGIIDDISLTQFTCDASGPELTLSSSDPSASVVASRNSSCALDDA